MKASEQVAAALEAALPLAHRTDGPDLCRAALLEQRAVNDAIGERMMKLYPRTEPED